MLVPFLLNRATVLNCATRKTYPTPLHEDNEACAKWCRNPCDYQKQKHIHWDCLSIRESVQEFRHFDIVVVKTAAQISDCLTKALPPQLHRAAVKTIFKI